jgi:hypothetical protein
MSITVSGCADISITRRYPTLFGVGSTVYIVAKARWGVLEKITIRRIFRTSKNIGVQPIFNYEDTLNGIWLENELCWQADALALAIAYWEQVLNSESSQTCIN